MKNQFPGSLFHSTGATQEVINLQPERVCKISTARSIQHLFTDNAPGRTFSNRRSGIRRRPSRPCSGAHAQASIAAIELPQGGMAAQNLGFPSLASAPNPPKEDSGPWIPRSSLKTHAEAAAELDGGCGCRGRQVRRLSGDGSGPAPTLTRDPGQPAARNFARFQKPPEIHFHSEKIEAKAGQGLGSGGSPETSSGRPSMPSSRSRWPKRSRSGRPRTTETSVKGRFSGAAVGKRLTAP